MGYPPRWLVSSRFLILFGNITTVPTHISPDGTTKCASCSHAVVM
ncbi:hypothetical protein P879_11801 [Paragonimus westermani]|uniref:LITAF domain-containing protein n=1 Tax=Paragonimus westermani TaxID=34504 RepID=A0A8T0D620_9TREM|nr:hypothetical protein P879_11801 [Paragonimus westermani]